MLDWMAQPLVAGIYGASPDALSLRATFPQFLELERTYGSVIFGLKKRRGAAQAASGARYSLFVTPRRGVQVLVDAIVKKLGSNRIRLNTKVVSITRSSPPTVSGGGSMDPRPGAAGDDGFQQTWQVVLATGEVLTADAVCLALPSHAAGDLLFRADAELSEELASIDYAPAATINMAFRSEDLKRTLEGVGFVIPQKENRLILGCTLADHKFEGRAPAGHTLLRAFIGGVQGTEWTDYDDRKLIGLVLEELRGWLGIVGEPLFTDLKRYPRALPQYRVGHLQKILRIEERTLRHPGLSLAGNWSYGIGIPDCIASGERAAGQLISYLERPAPAFS
jgi:oxygen-dependent protoporphyrinogen oxidase